MIRFLVRDVRDSLRRLVRLPIFAGATILSIAIAIGASTAIFNVLHAVLSYHLPLSSPQRLVSIDNQQQLNTMLRASFYESAKRFSSLEGVAEYHSAGANVLLGTLVQRRSAAEVSASFFRVLGITPILGRDFAEDQDQPGQDSVVLISYKLWQEAFHGDIAVSGQAIHLNGLTFTVIGVLPPGVDFPFQTDVWAPTIFDSNTYLREGTSVEISAIGRMSAHSNLNLVRAEANQVARQNLQAGEALGQDALPRVELLEPHLTEKIRPALLMLNLAVIFVLLIMCANVAHLILVRTNARIGDIAVRYALGARQQLIVQQQVVESMLLSFFGGSLGLGIAVITTHALYRLVPSTFGQFSATQFAWPVATYAFIATASFAILAALAPALFVMRHSVGIMLNLTNNRQSPHTGGFYDKLVISEIALALILLVGAGIFLRTLSDINRSRFAYETHGLLTFSLSPHGDKYVDYKGHAINAGVINALYTRVLAALEALPGVVRSAAISQPPITGKRDNVLPIIREGSATQVVPGIEYVVSPSYFQTMGLHIIEGRVPIASELAADKLVVVSQDFARQVWQDQPAVGQWIVLPMHGPFRYKVVAVTANSYRAQKSNAMSPELYLFIGQAYCPSATFIVRTRQEPELLLPFIQHAIAKIDPEQPLFGIQTMDQRIATHEANQRFASFVLSGFAIIAVLLAIGGLYSAMTMNLQSRMHEIGIRTALGATPIRIVRMLLLDGCRLSLPGICLGIIGVFVLARGASAMVFGSSTLRFLDVSVIALLFFLATVMTGYLAAKRAARLDPGELLRVE